MIIIMKGSSESQTPIVTIDTKTCHYPYAIRNAIELALEIDGYTKETIDEVFTRSQRDVDCEAKELNQNKDDEKS